jgi:addiction module RelE/StbE family toxin
MAQIRWSLTAENDLRAIEEFIAKDSVLHAISFMDRLVESAEKLSSSPKIGRMVPEFSREDLRELIFRSYRVVYQLHGDTVTILRVVHGARDLPGLVHREPWILE